VNKLTTISVIFSSFLFFWSCQNTNNESVSNEINKTIEDSTSINEKQESIYGFTKDEIDLVEGTIKPNENLSEILSNYNIDWPTINKAVEKSNGVFNIRNIQTKKHYEVLCDKDSAHTAKCFVYHPNRIEYVKFNFEDSVSVTKEAYPVDTVERVISGVIESSLYEAVLASNSSLVLAGMLSDVYAWQIDFFGLQKGDRFTVLYQELQVENEVVDIHAILAAEFIHSDETFDAFLFGVADSTKSYYDAEGASMRKSFLKAPLKFSRVSSKFSYSRLHPVLKYRRPHLGVDYAAPRGTPVVALGDGKIIKKAYSGGAGHMIKIKHNGTYTTGYLHLQKYAKGLHVGQYVKQGEIIAYVGSTGLSTGPHLDFRVWKDGKNVDPLKLKPPAAKSLEPELKPAFEIKKEEYLSKLKGLNNQLVNK